MAHGHEGTARLGLVGFGLGIAILTISLITHYIRHRKAYKQKVTSIFRLFRHHQTEMDLEAGPGGNVEPAPKFDPLTESAARLEVEKESQGQNQGPVNEHPESGEKPPKKLVKAARPGVRLRRL